MAKQLPVPADPAARMALIAVADQRGGHRRALTGQ